MTAKRCDGVTYYSVEFSRYCSKDTVTNASWNIFALEFVFIDGQKKIRLSAELINRKQQLKLCQSILY